jgi:hypothetical protein
MSYGCLYGDGLSEDLVISKLIADAAFSFPYLRSVILDPEMKLMI